MPKSQKEADQNLMKRAKANDPIAIGKMGFKCDDEGNYEGAIEYYTKAAQLGDMNAHYNLSTMYRNGDGVKKDMKRELYHLEEAAIGGHHIARHRLGCYEGNAGRYERAIKHYIIAATLGYDDGVEAVKAGFVGGVASKEYYEAALRGHQAAVDATKSKQRDEANAFYNLSP